MKNNYFFNKIGMIGKHSIFLLLFSIIAFTADAQKYVKVTATGSGNGSSWDNALGFSGLQAACVAGGTVYVAAGTYTFTTAPSNGYFIYRSSTTSSTSLVMVGGFPANATGTSLAGYDPVANPTIMDNGMPLTNNTPIFLRQDNAGLSLDVKGFVFNKFRGSTGSVFYCIGGTSAMAPTVIKFTDLVFKDIGVLTGDRSAVKLYQFQTAGQVIAFKNCVFDSNLSNIAGAISLQDTYNSTTVASANKGQLTIDGCRFVNNKAGNYGGAIQFSVSHGWTITNCCFEGNAANAQSGGAIYFTQSYDNIVTNCNFTNNTAGNPGGAIYADRLTGDITNCNFVGNVSASYGGAINGTGGGTSLNITNSKFYNNKGVAGGAIQTVHNFGGVSGTYSKATNCIFSGNEATGTNTNAGFGGGGALSVTYEGWIIDGSTFVNNKVASVSWGGAIYHGSTASTTINNSTFFGNAKGTATNISGSDIENENNNSSFSVITNSKMQLANAAAYTNKPIGPTSATSYAFGAGVTYNSTDPGVAAAPVLSCPATLAVPSLLTPAAQTATTSVSKSGNAATELTPSGGTSPYTYTNGASDPTCVAPSGATVLPSGSNLSITASTGAYTYTAPATPGTYYFCVKVCDAAATPNCKVATYTVIAAAAIQGPGGVSTGLKAWYRADKAVSPTTQWSDFSGNGKNVTKSFDPIPLNQSNATFNFNFNPYFEFSGTNGQYFYTTSGIMGTNATPGSFYSVVKSKRTSSWGEIVGFGNDDPSITQKTTTTYDFWRANATRGTLTVPSVDNTHIINGMWSTTGANYLEYNGLLSSQLSNTGTNITDNKFFIGTEEPGTIGTGNGSDLYIGGMGEVIVYNVNHALTTTERQKINSYLAIKYGTTLDQSTPQNYLASDGTVLWNATTNAGYKTNIAGVGRDDASALTQLMSKSVNAGETVTIYNGTVSPVLTDLDIN